MRPAARHPVDRTRVAAASAPATATVVARVGVAEPGPAVVRTVSVGAVGALEHGGRRTRTAIRKRPVDGPVQVGAYRLEGDAVGHRKAHGRADNAVCAFSAEDLAHWSAELGWPLADGDVFGENLTTLGLDLADRVIGEVWRVGTAVLQVCKPRTPCFVLGMRVSDPSFPRRAGRDGRVGCYLRVVEEGVLQAGDALEVLDRPRHGVTVGLCTRAYHVDRALAPRMLDAPQLSAELRSWAQTRA